MLVFFWKRRLHNLVKLKDRWRKKLSNLFHDLNVGKVFQERKSVNEHVAIYHQNLPFSIWSMSESHSDSVER